MSFLCAIPLISLLFACSEAPKVSYETIKLQRSTTIDCDGGAYNKGKVTELQILVDNVTIKRCKINGSIRTIGLGHNGEAPGVKASSITLGHTARAQAAAPKNTALYKVTITGHGRIPLYLGPGTTRLTMIDSTIKGRSDSVALYLDAESGFNIFRNNTFALASSSREAIALDSSADNQILSNTISASNGGIYLYRNCGEGGTVRHQPPQNNFIAGNTIDNTGGYGIWLGSRNGGRFYCNDDKGFPFGSSKDDGDFANDNTVRGNTFTNSVRAIRDDGKNETT
jgi:parallel beta-helix repeat protein